MPKKNSKSTITTSIFALLILAYTTYATVYEQIISQHNGFFNVIIFGVVLILVFIFITLIARIIGLRPENETSVFLVYFTYIMLIAIFVFFIIIRLRYSSSVPASESVPFNAANYLYGGNLSEGNEISDQLLNFPSNFMYATRLSLIFHVFDATSKTYIATNVILMTILALFVFLTVFLWANKTCAFVAVIIILFMPGNSFLVYSYNTELFVSTIFTMTLYLYSLLIFKSFKNNVYPIIIGVIAGLLAGTALCTEPTLILVYFILFQWFALEKKQPPISVLLNTAGTVASLSFFTVLKMLKMGVSITDVLMGYVYSFAPMYNRKLGENVSFDESYKTFLSRLNNPSRFLSENFYFLTNANGSSYSDNQAVWLKLADQLVYIFMLLMCVILIVYLLRAAYSRVVPGLSVLIAAFLGQFLGGINDVCYFHFTTLVIILGSCTFYYMYLNHHQDYAIMVATGYEARESEVIAIREGKAPSAPKGKNDPNEQIAEMPLSQEDMLRARALVFIGENEELYAQIKEQERIERINNPIVATKIQSEISESGEYISKEESIEFLDNLDEKIEVKEVHEVKAIPSTRPVEIVKPVLAESYEYDDSDLKTNNDVYYNNNSNNKQVDIIQKPSADKTDNYDDFDKFEKNNAENSNNDLNNFGSSDNIDKVIVDEDDNKYSVDGFVFRKKASNSAFANKAPVGEIKKPSRKEQKQLEKQEKVKLAQEKKAAKALAKGKKATKAAAANPVPAPTINEAPKPGEPLDNPLPGPKPHVAKELDFDYDLKDSDDFDWD